MNTTSAIEITERIRQTQIADRVVAAAEAVSRLVSSGISQEWDLAKDSEGREGVRLRLTDGFGGEATTDFLPGELSIVRHVEEKTRRLADALGAVTIWQSEVHTLCVRIREWIRELGEDVYIEAETVALHEPQAGHYRADGLRIRFGVGEMVVRPVARWVVGANGRVDFLGSEERFTLILIESEWLWVDDMAILDRDLFLKLARDCLGLA
ncbi:MAG: hypothetical protein M3552_02705 [Planctomycetota bacterium]|nr:hypothetical protein [Planctomycetaceae bacterium]MDQ3329557.1 hypothetical protein [Planctomycetota bacterium]